MKRLMIVFGTLLVALYLGSVPASAQHGNRPTTAGVSHGPSSHASSTATGNSPTSTGPQSASSLLSSNHHLDTALTNALGTLVPSGGLVSACQGFTNLGRCISAIHVANNRNINFFCLREELTGTALPTTSPAITCPTGTTSNGAKSLGQAIQKLDPNADPKVEASKAIKQANAEIKSAKS